MKKSDKTFSVLEAIVWYVLIVYFLYSVKNPVNIYVSGLIIVILGYIAFILCPVFRYSTGFRKAMSKK